MLFYCLERVEARDPSKSDETFSKVRKNPSNVHVLLLRSWLFVASFLYNFSGEGIFLKSRDIAHFVCVTIINGMHQICFSTIMANALHRCPRNMKTLLKNISE